MNICRGMTPMARLQSGRFGGLQDLDFPLIADETREIAQMLGMLAPRQRWRIETSLFFS